MESYNSESCKASDRCVARLAVVEEAHTSAGAGGLDQVVQPAAAAATVSARPSGLHHLPRR